MSFFIFKNFYFYKDNIEGIISIHWWARQDLNLRPSAPEADVLSQLNY
tara:strand:+ start:197 stop:340 length:144 start_codon:yes stop_codon:yes gene_type:complete